MSNNPLLYTDETIDSDELSDIITHLEECLDGIPQMKAVIAMISLSIYWQKPDLTMEELAEHAFEASKFIVARLVDTQVQGGMN